MKILYFSPSFQHPAVRGPTRCYNFIKELSKRHEITLFSLCRTKVPPEALDEMALYTKRIELFDASKARKWLKKKKNSPISLYANRKRVRHHLRTAIREMRSAFLQLVQEESYDIVLFHGKLIFSVIEDWNELPIVFDFCDASSMRIREQMRLANGFRRLALIWRYRKMKKTEKKILNKTPHLAFISCRDRDAVLNNHHKRTGIVPIGVDLDFWTRKTKRVHNNCIVFTGVMNYGPNQDAALYLIKNILPLVRPKIENLEVIIVGRDPSSELIELARRFDDVTVTGFVDDVRTYLERAALFVAPLRFASGIQNKILEALAMKLPVICSTPAAEGLYFDDDKNPPVRIADGTEAFAAGIVDLLKNQRELNRMAEDGRNFVQSRFNWSKSSYVLEKMLYNAVIEGAHVYEQAMN